MFDLESAVGEWRKEMLAAGIKAPATLEELEGHLREDISRLVATGRAEAEAFQIAVKRVGNPARVVAEFQLAKPGLALPVVAWLTWAGLAAILSVGLLSRWAEGKSGLLLTAHVFSLTTGYGAVLFAGGLGIYLVGARRFGLVAAEQEEVLNRTLSKFIQMAAGLVVAGLLSGMIWSKQNRGFCLGGDPRAIGTLGVAVWVVGLSLLQRFTRMSIRSRISLSIVGNMVVGVAWLGAYALIQGHHLGSYWPLNVWLGVHLVFLATNARPGFKSIKA